MKKIGFVFVCFVLIIFFSAIFPTNLGNLTSFPNLAYAQSCQVPPQVPNVAITFPNCVGNQCNFTQGGCSWASVSGASNYQVVITEVETGTSIINQQVASSTTNISFPVRETNTYKCDVSAISSCGTGAAGTSSLLCKVDAAVTVTPTNPPAFTPIPTAPFIPPKILPVTGNNNQVLFLSLGGFMLIIIGFVLLRF